MLGRRRFLSTLMTVGGVLVAPRAFGSVFEIDAGFGFDNSSAPARTLARYPQKTDLILLTDRPPQLETPLKYFETDLTPNDAFFVRWHLSGIPTSVDVQSFRLEVSGHVKKPLNLSLPDLRTKFEPVSLVALAQCAGNSRSLFEPRVPGGQWGNGAMGNARWTGARLKDVLDAAGVQPGAVQVGLRGLDEPPQPKTPPFEKSLQIDHARDGEVMIAYEMNGQPLPMLNGFPIRLIVPGWFATYWVKALTKVTVLDQPLKTFWMDKAYRIPDNPRANEDPQHLAETTVPINRMPVHSIFVKPIVRRAASSGTASRVQRRGDGRWLRNKARGSIRRTAARAGAMPISAPILGKYSWRRWRAEWTPSTKGKLSPDGARHQQ